MDRVLIDSNNAWVRERKLSPLMERDWLAPGEVVIDGNDLLARYSQPKRVSPSYKEMTEGILYGLIRLADEKTEAPFIDYAKRWGILGLCEHGMPIGHRLFSESAKSFQEPVSAGLEPAIIYEGCKPERREEYIVEPLERWRYYARLVKAIVSLVVVLKKAKPLSDEKFEALISREARGKRIIYPSIIKLVREDGTIVNHVSTDIPGNPEDWSLVLGEMGRVVFENIDPVNLGRVVISRVINHWLEINGVRPYCWWTSHSSTFNLQSNVSWNGLLPVVAVRLMLMLSDSADYSLCAKCRKPFYLRPGQSVSESRKNYCIDCGRRAAQQEANKRYYKAERENPDRKKRKRLTPKQREAIARALNKPKPETVRSLAEKYGVSVWAIYKTQESMKKSGTE